MVKDVLWYLQNIDFFKDIDTITLEKIKKKTTLKSYKKDSFIYFQDDQPGNVFFVKTGRIKIGTYSEEGREIIKIILENGEVFGEQFLLGNAKMENYAQAMEATCLLIIEQSEFQKIMEHNNFVAMRLAKIFGRRLQKLEKKFEALIFKDARSRIVDFIREMASETGKAVGYETLIMHSMTHLDIAHITATSRQTVTTVLNELREDNQIYFDRKRILVRDLTSLS